VSENKRPAASSGKSDRAGLTQMLDKLHPGDVVVVVKLDRLSRSLADLLRTYP
jgi:DNA invertase Pin-like site-specific DNA recombinase